MYQEDTVATPDSTTVSETQTGPGGEATRTVTTNRTIPVVAPDTVVETRQPSRVIQTNDDPVANVFAASQLIQTIVWSVVIIVLLVVLLLALHAYAHLF